MTRESHPIRSAVRKTGEIALKYGIPLATVSVAILALKHGVFQHVQLPFAGHSVNEFGQVSCIPHPYDYVSGQPITPNPDPSCHPVDVIQYTDKIGQGLFGLVAVGGVGTGGGFAIADVVKLFRK